MIFHTMKKKTIMQHPEMATSVLFNSMDYIHSFGDCYYKLKTFFQNGLLMSCYMLGPHLVLIGLHFWYMG